MLRKNQNRYIMFKSLLLRIRLNYTIPTPISLANFFFTFYAQTDIFLSQHNIMPQILKKIQFRFIKN